MVRILFDLDATFGKTFENPIITFIRILTSGPYLIKLPF
jgi:hypothetical protein